MSQGDLFAENRQWDRLTEKQFEVLLSAGFNPAFALKVDPDDRPAIAAREVSVKDKAGALGIAPWVTRTFTQYMIVLYREKSMGERKIVFVMKDSKKYLNGLYIGLLKRQVRFGSTDVKSWAFGTLMEIEKKEPSDSLTNNLSLDYWSKELLFKDDDPDHIPVMSSRRKYGRR